MDSPPAMSPSEIVRSLLKVISRQLPLSAANDLLDENLCAYMDGKKIGRGKQPWFRWVQFLQYNADKTMSELSVEVETMRASNESDDIIEVSARWCGCSKQQKTFSDLGTVSYQVRNGKIINIWTHRANYVFIYGERIASNPLAFYWLLARLAVWTPPAIPPVAD